MYLVGVIRFQRLVGYGIIDGYSVLSNKEYLIFTYSPFEGKVGLKSYNSRFYVKN
jgi:hypothetical protein